VGAWFAWNVVAPLVGLIMLAAFVAAAWLVLRILYGRPRAPKPAVPAGQTRKKSMLEAWTNTVVGLFISYAIQVVTFPWFGIHVGTATHIGITAVFFVASIGRGYALRRFFNWLDARGRESVPANA
jgi:hypothetical protein